MNKEQTQLFEQQIKTVKNQLFYHAFKLSETKEDAEDLVQDTLLKAYKYFNRFQQGSSLLNWTLKIMTNQNIDNLRKKKLFIQKREEGVELNRYETQHNSVYNTALSNLEVERIDEKIDKVKYKKLIKQRARGYTYEEISKEFGLPIGTVKAQLFRGRKQLEKELMSI